MNLKIKQEIIDMFNNHHTHYQFAGLNDVSPATIKRWFDTNDNHLLMYPNLLEILKRVNERTGKSLQIRDILDGLENYPGNDTFESTIKSKNNVKNKK